MKNERERERKREGERKKNEERKRELNTRVCARFLLFSILGVFFLFFSAAEETKRPLKPSRRAQPSLFRFFPTRNNNNN